jgi:hypothetical protein
MEATSPENLFMRLEDCTQLMRMSDKVWPTMYRCATVSLAELEAIKTIGTITRQGRVVRLRAGEVKMEHGTYTPQVDTLNIDCSANALTKFEPVPVFRDKHITLQPVRQCQQVFSAALIAHVEATYADDKLKNELCRAIPFPDEAEDWLTVTLQGHRNALAWAAHPKTAAWLSRARLDWNGALSPSAPTDPVQAAKFRAAVEARIRTLCAKLEQLIDQLPKHDGARGDTQLAKL